MLSASMFLKAQEPVSVNLSEKDGLPDKEFYNIIEDSKGFIWLCADKGLFRYDGKSFKNYSNKEKRGLSVFGVKEDAQGRIWSNNITGQFFYVENNVLHTFIDLSKTLKGELAVFEIVNDDLLVFTQQTIYKVNLNTKTTETIYTPNLSNGNPFRFNNTIYFGSVDAINSIDSKLNIKYLVPIELKLKDKNNVSVIQGKSSIFKLDSLLFYRQRRYQKNEFFQIDLSKKRLKKTNVFKALSEEQIQNTFENDNQIWIATTKGVWIYEYENDGIQLKRQFLKDNNITKIIKDKDDNYWFITLNSGVYVIPNIYIERYNISESNKNISSLDKIDEHALYFGTNNGDVGFYNIKTNTETIVNVPKNSRVSAIRYNPKKNISYIAKDLGGFLLDHKTLQWQKFNDISSTKSVSILDNEDVLFLDYKNTFVYKKGDITSKKIILDGKRPYTSYFSSLYASVYVGYVDGLIKYDSLWKAKTIAYKKQPIYGLSITETKNGLVWVATFKDGVIGIKNDEVIHHFTTENGLISNRIEKVKADGNSLWIATDSGIQLLNVENETFKTLRKRDGVVSYDISGIEVLENTVVFSSNEGLFAIDKAKAFKTQKSPEVYFNQFEINEQAVEIKKKYRLEYDQNTINIGYNVNGFQFNQKGKYAYRLIGLNKDWITTKTGVNTVKYNSLPSGKYTFEVKPVLGTQTEESKIQSLQFSIKRPFWKTWWFISGISVLILGSVVLYFQRKIKRKEAQRQLEVKQLSLDNELIALKLENLRSQMNPHFIFNALNSIQEYIVLNQKKLASDYLGKFADLIRTYLNHSSKGNITLQEEINCLEMYLELEKLRFEDKLQYTTTVSGSLNASRVLIPTMLVQPYVENALKHGLLHRKDNRKLNIGFFINDDTKLVKCRIIDNGVGREKAAVFKARSHKNHTSFATKATEDRLNLLNYGKEKQVAVTITDLFENNTPTGTQVEISIPFTID